MTDSSIGDFTLVDSEEIRGNKVFRFQGYLAYKGKPFYVYGGGFDVDGNNGFIPIQNKHEGHSFDVYETPEFQETARKEVVATMKNFVSWFRDKRLLSRNVLIATSGELDAEETCLRCCYEMVQMLLLLEKVQREDNLYRGRKSVDFYMIAVYKSFKKSVGEPLESVTVDIRSTPIKASTYNEAFKVSKALTKGVGIKRDYIETRLVGLFVGQGIMDWNLSVEDYVSLLSV